MSPASSPLTTTKKTHGGARSGAGRPRGSTKAAKQAILRAQAQQVHKEETSTRTVPESQMAVSRLSTTRPQASGGAGLSNWWSTRVPQHNAPTLLQGPSSEPASTQPQPPALSSALQSIYTELALLTLDDPGFDPTQRIFNETVEDNPGDGVDEEENENENENEEELDKESRDAEAPLHSVNEQWLRTSLAGIQKDVELHGQPQCYCNGQLWIRPIDPIFALQRAATSGFSPDTLYLLPIFVWLPDCLPGRPDRFKCECGQSLNRHGYNPDPIARRVGTTSGSDYFLLTNRFLCPERRAQGRGCGKTFQGTDPLIQAQLPQYVQARFPVCISHRGALDNDEMDMMKITFAGRFGASPYSKMVQELKYLQHSRLEGMYLQAAAHFNFYGPEQIPSFSQFGDRSKYGGFTPSVKYLKGVFVGWFAAHRLHLDRIMSSISGKVLKGDHTYTIVDHQGHLPGGERIHEALYSNVNEHEEVRGYTLTPTQGFSSLTGYYQRMQTELVRHGYQPTELVYTDKPRAERNWFETNIPSLARDVQHISPDRFRHIELACNDILEDLMGLPVGEPLLLALDVKCNERGIRYIQIRSRKGNYVFYLPFITSPHHLPACLASVLTSTRIVKFGHRVRDTITSINQHWALELPKTGFVDLGQLAKLKGKVKNTTSSLSTLSGVVLKHRLPELTRTVWDGNVSADDVDVLAREVECSWGIVNALMGEKSTGLHLRDDEMHPGTLVTVFLQQRAVASGELVAHDGWWTIPNDEELRIKVTKAYSVVKLTEILVPGCMIAKHQQTLEWLNEHGQHAVVQTRTLRSRALEPPDSSDDDVDPSFGTPAPVSIPEDVEMEELPSVPLTTNTTQTLPGLADFPIDEDSDSDLEGDDPESTTDNLEQTILNALRDAGKTIRQGDANTNLASRVLDDAYHFIDRLLRLISKKHSAYKEFAHQLSKTIFIPDKGDEERVRKVLESKGISWEYAQRAKKAALDRRIRHFIPPPAKLGRDLQILFHSFRNIEDAADRKAGRGKFFSKAASHQADILVETAYMGFLSDPNGWSMYFLIGYDSDGLPLYRTFRGTNSLEGGVHMIIRRIFGSLNASLALTEALLANWFNRRNCRVGHYNRTGTRWKNHFDLWLLDKNVESAIEVGVETTFSEPRLLATRIATSETFGIIPISPEVAKEAEITILPTPNILSLAHDNDTHSNGLLRFSTKPMQLYRYLQIRQRTTVAVVPVHTRPEFELFKRNIAGFISTPLTANSGADDVCKITDYIAFAVFWNRRVRAQPAHVLNASERIYFKLPEQLLRHHKKTLQWTASRATLTLGSNTDALEPINSILKHPNRTAILLPVLEFEPIQVDFHKKDADVGVNLNSFNPMALRNERVAARVPAEPLSPTTITPVLRQPSPPPVAGPSNLAGLRPTYDPSVLHQTIISLGATDSRDYNALEIARPTKKVAADRPKKRCGLCVLAKCKSAEDCPGSGARRLCMHITDAAHAAGMNQRVRKRAVKCT
ncbi:hypothetical protein GGX14DRAFT_578453 [Mycena pura]|uniref:3'-5' exonuclease domain-containing protein n=1 Tax=Mycena pura TaxID=153505 RepID=A0AAD6Y306_9AGAR|nr:hypothetical protein GGX14DRAFT_578453 [Mycena pura]